MNELTALLTTWGPTLLAMLATGVVAGILAGLLGVGGGIVIVPVLFFVLQSMGVSTESAMLIATATSLMVIVPTSISSMRSHHKKGNVDIALVKRWAPFMVIGVVLGSMFALYAKGQVTAGIFGVVAILVALNMALRAKAPPFREELPALPGQASMAGGIGFFSVMMGVGGGTLGVPLMNAFGVKPHRAVGTASAFGLLIALPGVLILLFANTPIDAPEGTLGLVNLPGFACIVPLTVLFAPVGVKIASRLKPEMLKRVFAVFLCVSGGRMLMQVFAG